MHGGLILADIIFSKIGLPWGTDFGKRRPLVAAKIDPANFGSKSGPGGLVLAGFSFKIGPSGPILGGTNFGMTGRYVKLLQGQCLKHQ